MQINNEVYQEKFKNIKETLEDHNNKLEEHSNKIQNLEKESMEYKTEIRNLILKMDSFISTVKWLCGFLVAISTIFVAIIKN